jgi:hypothetical protein
MKESIYESLFPEDCKQYREVSVRYKKLRPENYQEAYEIMILAWEYANRWSEIASNISILAVEQNVRKTDLKDYCYQRYRQMQLLHESARMLHRMGFEQAMYFERRDKT